MLTVHGRTRCQFYSGKADWTAIGEVKKAVSIPVVANGDCASLADAASMLAQSGADAVMIGRSAIGAAVVRWRCRSLSGAWHSPGRNTSARSAKARRSNISRLCSKSWVPAHGVRHARKHLAAYAEWAGVRDGALLRQRLVTARVPERGQVHPSPTVRFSFVERRRHERALCSPGTGAGGPATANGDAGKLLNALPHPVVAVLPDGSIANANPAAEAFFGMSRTSLWHAETRQSCRGGTRRSCPSSNK